MGGTSFSLAKPTLLFVGELDDLSFQIVKILLTKDFKIYLLSNKTATWNKVIISENISNVKLIKKKDIVKIQSVDYFIFHINLFNVAGKNLNKVREKFLEDLQVFNNTDWAKRSKNLFLIPALKGLYINKLPINGRTIYFSETFGPHMVFADFPTFKIFETLVKKGRLTLPNNKTLIRPIFSETLAEKLLRVMLSISYSYEITFLGEGMAQKELIEQVNTEGFSGKVIYSEKKGPEYFTTHETTTINSKSEIEKAPKYFKEQRPKEEQLFKKKSKIIRNAALVALIFLLTPLILICLSFFGLFVSYRFAIAGKYNVSQKATINTFYVASAANKELTFLSNLPIVGRAFYAPLKITRICMKSAKLGEEGVGIMIKMGELTKKILGDESYTVSDYTDKLSTELDYIYEETGFILSEIDSSVLLKKLFNTIIDKNMAAEDRSDLIGLSQLVKSLPQILGEKEIKKYLILLQNNMELRPTGGYIGSFALVTFEGGRMSEIELWDVFEADGQLKGHIEPPAPIKAYLGEANWFLRDSNWDPDFKVSAKRAAWFLDKEIDEKVDGVIGADLEFIKRLLVITGPLEISDYDVVVNEKNLYEITQREVEQDFFPGSKKKASFLNALSKKLSEEIKGISLRGVGALGKSLRISLEQRHIQIFLNEEFAQSAIEKLGWDGGEVVGISCGKNCYSDFFGTVEANLGVNKANQYISREMAVLINIKNGNVLKVLNLSIKNSAPKESGLKGEYKAYVRLLVPKESVVENITLTKGGKTTNLPADTNDVSRHKEVGVLVIISPGELGVLNFSWRTPTKISFENKGEYRILVRKQAGTLETPLELTYLLGSKRNIVGYPPFSLTRQEYFGYNASLTKDFLSRVSW